jgi:hypothetical protein
MLMCQGALSARNGELASQLALATTKKAAAEKELAAKSARLLELEKAVASLSAAERVVARGAGGAAGGATGGTTGGDGKSIETCTEGEGNGRLCLKMETVPSRLALGTRFASAKAAETPGLVAIAGAVAAVWVFALVMEKRKAMYE